jgi:hypothetical protein
MSPSLAVFLVGEVALLLVAQAVGGAPWTLVALVAVVTLSLSGPAVESLACAASALIWLGVFHVTGDREFFFPYSMHLATAAIVAGTAVAAAFLGVRVWQQASAQVLAVECAVAAAIVGGAVLLRGRLPRTRANQAAIIAAAAVAAYAGLAL